MTPGVRGWFVLFLLAMSALSFSCAAGLSIKVARGAEGHTHAGAVGRFYQSWMMPDAPHLSCCHDEDCGPAQSRFQNGHWEARWRSEDEWTPIPVGKVEQDRDTPDGRSHMCGRKSGVRGEVIVFCFVRGNAA